MIELHDIVGSIAAFLTTVAFFPQVLKVIRTRETKAISLMMYVVFASGVAMWLTYGYLIESWPIIVGNIITLACACIVIVMKVRLG